MPMSPAKIKFGFYAATILFTVLFFTIKGHMRAQSTTIPPLATVATTPAAPDSAGVPAACPAGAAPATALDIAPAEAEIFLREQAPFVLDVRTPAEYRDGHLPGAVLIPVGELPDRLAELDSLKNRPILVYCRSGNRSRLAADILSHRGFAQIRNLAGGISAWKGAVLN